MTRPRYSTNTLTLAARPAASITVSVEAPAPSGVQVAVRLRSTEFNALPLASATSALDIAHQIEVLSLVRQLSRDRGLSVIMVLHDVNMAARFCDEIIALHSGRIVARGLPEAIIKPTILEKIYGVSMGVMSCPDTGHPVSFVR